MRIEVLEGDADWLAAHVDAEDQVADGQFRHAKWMRAEGLSNAVGPDPLLDHGSDAFIDQVSVPELEQRLADIVVKQIVLQAVENQFGEVR